MEIIWIITSFIFRAIYASYNVKIGEHMTGSNRLVLILFKEAETLK